MGSAASALLDVASELNLNHEQRKRYRGLYLELAKTGKTPNQIIAILNERIIEEREKEKSGIKDDSPEKFTTIRRNSLTKSAPHLSTHTTASTSNHASSSVVTTESTSVPISSQDSTPATTPATTPASHTVESETALSARSTNKTASVASTNNDHHHAASGGEPLAVHVGRTHSNAPHSPGKDIARESSNPMHHSSSASHLHHNHASGSHSSPTKKHKGPALAAAQLETEVEEPENILDHLLDGITEESRNVECRLCKVKFELPSQLRRHLSFSQLHAGNAQDYITARNRRIRELVLERHIRQSIAYMGARVSQVRRAQHVGRSAAALRWYRSIRMVILQLWIYRVCNQLLKVSRFIPETVPANPMLVLYSGSKLFWRTQENFELYIYHLEDVYVVPPGSSERDSVIQISGYSTQTKQRTDTLYVNYRALVSLLERQARNIAESAGGGGSKTSAAVAVPAPAASATVVRRKSMDSLFSADVVEITYEMISEYLLSHLELAYVPGNVSRIGLTLAASASSTIMSDTPAFSVVVGQLLGFGKPVQAEVVRANSSNNSAQGLVSRNVSSKVQAIIRNISNSRTSNLSERARIDVADSIALMHADTSQAAQAKRLLGLQVPPLDAITLKSVELPKWELATLTQPPKGHVNMKIADLNRQTRQLKELARAAEHFSIKVEQNMQDYAIVATTHHLPAQPKAKPHKKGGVTMETVASQQRHRRRSIG